MLRIIRALALLTLCTAIVSPVLAMLADAPTLGEWLAVMVCTTLAAAPPTVILALYLEKNDDAEP